MTDKKTRNPIDGYIRENEAILSRVRIQKGIGMGQRSKWLYIKFEVLDEKFGSHSDDDVRKYFDKPNAQVRTGKDIAALWDADGEPNEAPEFGEEFMATRQISKREVENLKKAMGLPYEEPWWKKLLFWQKKEAVRVEE